MGPQGGHCLSRGWAEGQEGKIAWLQGGWVGRVQSWDWGKWLGFLSPRLCSEHVHCEPHKC